MPHAIRIHETGGPEVMRWERVEVGAPGPGEVRLVHAFVGLNYIDVYHRSGAYTFPSFPVVLGQEASGRVEAVGPGVTELAVGDRVAYASHPMGAYAEARLMPADRCVKLPDGVDDRTAAAVMLKGLTAQYLIRRTFRVEPGHVVLYHAAAGGTGLIACQWLRALGATVIGTVSTDEKAELAAQHGCHHVIVSSSEDVARRVRELTGGRGADVAYDGVGRATWDASLDALRPRGMMVSFGNASGPVPPVAPLALAARGSLVLTRPRLSDYTSDRRELEGGAAEVFEAVLSGRVRVRVGQSFSLRDAAVAHRELEARRTTGSTVLVV
jgi:NADPH2:quinone reductase